MSSNICHIITRIVSENYTFRQKQHDYITATAGTENSGWTVFPCRLIHQPCRDGQHRRHQRPLKTEPTLKPITTSDVSQRHRSFLDILHCNKVPGSYQARSGRMLSSKRVQFGDRGTAATSAERGDNGPWERDKKHRTHGKKLTDDWCISPRQKPASTPPPSFHSWCTYWWGVGVDVWAQIYACTSHSNSLKWIWGSPPVLWDSSPCMIISASSMKDCINCQTAQAPSLHGGGGGLQGFPPSSMKAE